MDHVKREHEVAGSFEVNLSTPWLEAWLACVERLLTALADMLRGLFATM
jgi:hypothetical protein